MRVELITIGNELLDGRRVDSNTATLGRALAPMGLMFDRRISVLDDVDDVCQAFLDASKHGDLIISTGGLGPTDDDLTFEALAEAMGVELVFSEDIWKGIQSRFAARGLDCPKSNRKQAFLPKGARPLTNPKGTAPGLHTKLGACDVFVFPGVPSEMGAMLESDLMPFLSERLSKGRTLARTYQLSGLPESEVADRLSEADLRGRWHRDFTLAYTASFPVIELTFHVPEEKVSTFSSLDGHIQDLFGDVWVGTGTCSLAEGLVARMREQKLTLAIAESMTGGMLSSELVDVAGASEILLEGWIAYSNASKVRDLGVSEATLDEHGAVSEAVALEMAQGACQRSGSLIGISTTGIAGPAGGSAQKPVGLTHVAVVSTWKTASEVFTFRWGRQMNRKMAVIEALKLLRHVLDAKK